LNTEANSAEAATAVPNAEPALAALESALAAAQSEAQTNRDGNCGR